MKRKVVVTMAIAFWVNDDTFDNRPETNSDVSDMVETWDDTTILEEGEEFNVIKAEVVEVKE